MRSSTVNIPMFRRAKVRSKVVSAALMAAVLAMFSWIMVTGAPQLFGLQ